MAITLKLRYTLDTMDLSKLNASDGTGEAVQASVTAIRVAGSTTLQVDSLDNWPSDFIATSGKLLPDDTLDPSAIVFSGHKTGSNITIDSLAPGYSDSGSAVNDVVVIKPTTLWADMVANAIKAINGIGTAIAASFSTLTTSGNTTIGGNLVVNGTSRIASGGVTSAATITPSAQIYNVTGLAVNATVNIPSFTAGDGMGVILRIKDNGTPRALTFASGWANVSGLDTPTTTTTGKLLTIGALYSSASSKWEIQGINNEA